MQAPLECAPTCGAKIMVEKVTKKEGKLRAMRLAEVLKCPHDEVS